MAGCGVALRKHFITITSHVLLIRMIFLAKFILIKYFQIKPRWKEENYDNFWKKPSGTYNRHILYLGSHCHPRLYRDFNVKTFCLFSMRMLHLNICLNAWQIRIVALGIQTQSVWSLTNVLLPATIANYKLLGVKLNNIKLEEHWRRLQLW